jgi:hypothetical protein
MLVWILTMLTATATVNLGTYTTQYECVEQMAIMQPGPDADLTCRSLSYTITERSQDQDDVEPSKLTPMS